MKQIIKEWCEYHYNDVTDAINRLIFGTSVIVATITAVAIINSL